MSSAELLFSWGFDSSASFEALGLLPRYGRRRLHSSRWSQIRRLGPYLAGNCWLTFAKEVECWKFVLGMGTRKMGENGVRPSCIRRIRLYIELPGLDVCDDFAIVGSQVMGRERLTNFAATAVAVPTIVYLVVSVIWRTRIPMKWI